MSKRVAVILSGCGVMDGSEIHESVLTLLALDQSGATYVCCAPDKLQHDVIDHAAGKPTSESRNVLAEAARIARGKIKNLAEIKAADFDAVILPGGYGAAKNLCTYATDGQKAQADPETARVVREFHAAGKTIGAICIAPVILAIILGKEAAPSLTIGTDDSTAIDICSYGANHVDCGVRDFVVDQKNRIVTTPAYMLGKGPAEVFTGIEKLVKTVLEMS